MKNFNFHIKKKMNSLIFNKKFGTSLMCCNTFISINNKKFNKISSISYNFGPHRNLSNYEFKQYCANYILNLSFNDSRRQSRELNGFLGHKYERIIENLYKAFCDSNPNSAEIQAWMELNVNPFLDFIYLHGTLDFTQMDVHQTYFNFFQHPSDETLFYLKQSQQSTFFGTPDFNSSMLLAEWAPPVIMLGFCVVYFYLGYKYGQNFPILSLSTDDDF